MNSSAAARRRGAAASASLVWLTRPCGTITLTGTDDFTVAGATSKGPAAKARS